jgi:hypothetical protein
MRIWSAGILGLLLMGGVTLAEAVAPIGGQFQINSYTTGQQSRARVASDGQGDFVVVWYGVGSKGTDTSYSSIQARRFGANAVAKGTDFQVNTYTTSLQYRPALAVNGPGSFVVAWQSYGSSGTDTDTWSIQAQRFDNAGAPQGPQFQVNSYTTNQQERPAVALDSEGAFVVVWQSRGSDGTDTSHQSIQGQFYDASGKPVGGQFQVNSYTLDNQRFPTVTPIDPEGNFVVVWESLYANGADADWSIQSQRFASRPVFIESFESGGLSGWSDVVQ